MDKLAKYLIIAGATAIILFLGWYFRTVLLYIAVAVVVALIGKPVVKALCRIQIKGFHFPRWLASGLTLALIICICLSLFLLLAPMIGEFVHLVNNMSLSLSRAGFQAGSILVQLHQGIHKHQHLLQHHSLAGVIHSQFRHSRILSGVHSILPADGERPDNRYSVLHCPGQI